MTKPLHLIGFSIGRETFGVPIELVHQIVGVPDITAIPESPDCVEGVINLRGKIVSIVDLRKRFGEKDIRNQKKNRVLVVEVEGKLLGLIVDSASEVIKIPRSEIEQPPNVFDEGGLNYVTGVGKLNGRLIILVDLTKILQRGELRRVGELAQTGDGHAPASAASTRASGATPGRGKAN